MTLEDLIQEDDFFVTPVSFEKTGSELILGDPKNWEHEITKHIYDKMPFIGKFDTTLQFQKKDEQAGFAYGTLVINNALTVPVIISSKNGKPVLAPMDIFNHNGKWLPLNEERLDEILFNHQIFDRVAKPGEEVKKEDTSLGNYTRPPDSGREIIASLLDQVLPTASRYDLEKVLDEIDSNEKIAAGFVSNGTFSAVRKLAAESSKSTDDKSAINSELPASIIEIEKVAGKYKVTTTSDYLYAPESITVDSRKIRELFGDSVLKEASINGYHIIEDSRNKSNVFISGDLKSGFAEIESDGTYIAKLAGSNKDGIAFINVVDFDLDPVSEKIFTNGNVFAFQEKIAGKESSTPSSRYTKEAGITGDYGTFIFGQDLKHSIATIPVKLKSVITKTAEGIQMEGETIYGKEIQIVCTPLLKTIVKEAGKYYVPSCMRFIPLGNKASASFNYEDMDKVANLSISNGNNLTIKWTGNSYAISGMVETKPDSLDTEHGVDKFAALSALVKLGSTVDEAKLILRRSEADGIVKASGFNHPIQTVARKADTNNGRLKFNTVKLAAAMPDEATVDSVLSLNFITPQNIKVFGDYVPQFEECISHLAALLLATRLGLPDIDGQAVKNAKDVIDGVVRELKSMFAVKDTLKNVTSENEKMK